MTAKEVTGFALLEALGIDTANVREATIRICKNEQMSADVIYRLIYNGKVEDIVKHYRLTEMEESDKQG
jgi:hypothetical protein